MNVVRKKSALLQTSQSARDTKENGIGKNPTPLA